MTMSRADAADPLPAPKVRAVCLHTYTVKLGGDDLDEILSDKERNLTGGHWEQSICLSAKSISMT